MRAQELFIDVVSGRFLDGNSAIPISKPTIYSDEKKTLLLNLRQVRNNRVSSYPPDPESRYKFRLGTPALKLAEGVDVTTAPPQLFNATATVVTKSPVQALGRASILTNVVTPSYVATLNNSAVATYSFTCDLDFKASAVTATITVSITTLSTFFTTTTKTLPLNRSFASTKFVHVVGGPQSLRSLELTPTLNSPSQAVLSTTISGGIVTTIGITARGIGYPDGTFNINFSGGSPSVTATAVAVASGGVISSITINDGGSGYGSAPTASLFLPEKSISFLSPTNEIGSVNGKKRFFWAEAAPGQTQVPIRFSSPDATSTTAPLTSPSGFLVHAFEDQWEINLIDGGYGYVVAPTVTHDTALVGAPEFALLDGGTTTISRVGTMTLNYGGVAHSLYNLPRGSTFISNERTPNTIFTNSFSDEYEDVGPKKITENFRANLKAIIATQDITGRGWNVPADVDIDSIVYYATPTRDPDRVNQATFDSATFESEDVYKRFANSEFFVALSGGDLIYPADKRLPLFKVTIPAVKDEYVYSIDFHNRLIKKTNILAGGIFEFSMKMVDGGNDGLARVSAEPICGFTSQTIQESPIPLNITVLTASNLYYPTILSSLPTVTSAQGELFTKYFFSSLGFGFASGGTNRRQADGRVVITQISSTTGGAIVRATATTSPRGYRDGEYDYQISVPTGGTAAKIKLQINRGVPRVILVDGGSGYTQLPTITPPSPFVNSSGGVASIGLRGMEYILRYGTGGTTVPIFRKLFNRAISLFKPNPNSSIPRQDRPLDFPNVVSDLVPAEDFIPYDLDKRYPLDIDPSPSGSSARAEFYFLQSQQTYRVDRLYPIGGNTPAPGTPDLGIDFGGIAGTNDPGKFTLIRAVPTPPPSAFALIPIQIDPKTTRFGQIVEGRVTYLVVDILDTGLGYTTPPSALAPSTSKIAGGSLREIRRTAGNLNGLFENGKGVGNDDLGGTRYYEMLVQESPVLGGNARAVLDAKRGVVNLINPGYGYLTPPIVTGPQMLRQNGEIVFTQVTASGLGYGPGEYAVTIAATPGVGGTTASIIYYVPGPTDPTTAPQFVIIDGGSGYSELRPNLTAVAPTGSVISGITIVCAGNFYTVDTAIKEIIDTDGSGCVLGQAVVSAGKIQSIPVLAGGYGYSNTPQINIAETFWPGPTELDLAQVQGNLEITTASANAILTTANNRDVFLEVYETDGTNEQVVVQATMNLAKRVLE